MKWERREVLRGVAALTGATLGGAVTGEIGSEVTDATVGDRAIVGASAASEGTVENERNEGEEAENQQNENAESQQEEGVESQQVDTSLSPGVTLFDLNGDGAFTATVERASSEMQDDAHPGPIHVTSQGRETVDFAASVVQPDGQVTLGGLNRLTFDYYEGPENGGGGQAGAAAPGQTFVVVENADGRHGAYLAYGAGTPAEEWLTHDVLAQLQGDTAGTNGWFEYTPIEENYDGKTFDDFVGRFGTDARLLRVGVGLGSAANPTTLDVFYDNLSINDATRRFPTEVVNRVSNVNPL